MEVIVDENHSGKYIPRIGHIFRMRPQGEEHWLEIVYIMCFDCNDIEKNIFLRINDSTLIDMKKDEMNDYEFQRLIPDTQSGKLEFKVCHPYNVHNVCNVGANE